MQTPKLHYIEQRSPEWYHIREGKITGTKVTSILGKLSLAKTQQAIDNLAMKLAIESVHGMIESDYISFDMQRGIDNEPNAIELLTTELGKEFIDVTLVGFAEYSEHIGASPDAICSNNHSAQVKCPNTENYFKLILSGQMEQSHYYQIQHEILCTGSDGAYYLNYCVHKGEEFSMIKHIGRDESTIKLILERCDIVTEKKLVYIDKLKQTEKIFFTIHDTKVIVHDSI